MLDHSSSSHAGFDLLAAGHQDRPTTREDLTILRCTWCFFFCSLRGSAFLHGHADSANPDGRRGSNAYKVNLWLWQFGSMRKRLGGLSVPESTERRDKCASAAAKKGAETRQRRVAARRADE